MNRFLLWLAGISKIVWAFVEPFLRSKVAEIMNDARIQRLAIRVVERVSGLDLDGDGKHDAATELLRNEAKDIGYDLAKGIAASIVQVAYEKCKAEIDKL